MISGRDSGAAVARYLNLFDSKQMENTTGTEKRAALNLNYSKMRITGVEEEEKNMEPVWSVKEVTSS